MKRDLLLHARDALKGTRRPKAINLRRAVSDSYYALFHALCQMSADHLVGSTQRSSEAWRRVYRGHDHRKLKDELSRNDIKSVDPVFARISAAFITLQEARHVADYDPFTIYRRRSDVMPLIDAAETAINSIEGLAPDLSRRLATILLIKHRAS